jgi:uncharacterized protein YcbX
MDKSNAIEVVNLMIFPLKSGHEIELQTSKVTPQGLENDRVLVMLKKEGIKFMTIRDYPLMYNIKTSTTEEPGIYSMQIPVGDDKFNNFEINTIATPDKQKFPKVMVQVNSTDVQIVSTEEIEKALYDYLNVEVYIASALGTRNCKDIPDPYPQMYTKEIKDTDDTYFADLCPLLITSEESLEQVNKWIAEKGGEPVRMINFRPNIVLKGGSEPFWEDKVYKIKIGDVVYRRVKDCGRCKLSTFDPIKGEFSKDKYPLSVLKEHRKNEWDEMVFGQNFGVDLSETKSNVINVGDKVEIIE